MSSAYYRLKKHRQLKRQSDVELMTSDVEQNLFETLDSSIDLPMEIDVSSNSPSYPQSMYSSEHTDTQEHDNYFDNNSPNLSDSCFGYSDRSPEGSLPDYETSQQSPNPDYDEQTEPNFREKLQDWAVKHRSHLTVETIEDLLGILRAENIPNLPKSATTLLQTKSNTNIKLMNSSKNTTGFFMYLGIEQGLRDIILMNILKMLFACYLILMVYHCLMVLTNNFGLS